VHGSVEVVDEDLPGDPDLVAEARRGDQLLLEAPMGGKELAWMCLARVDEVPVPVGMLRCQLVEQRTLCAAVRSGEGAELEYDAPPPPHVREADARSFQEGELAVGGPLARVEHVRKPPELTLVLARLDVRVEPLIVVGAHDSTPSAA